MPIMPMDNKIRDEKLQYDINREPARISGLSSGEVEKYEYLTSEEILPPDQSIMIKQDEFNYSPFEIAFEKQIKTMENQREKQVKVLKVLNLVLSYN